MHQMVTRIGGNVPGVLTDTIILRVKVRKTNKPECNKILLAVFGKQLSQNLNTTPRELKFQRMSDTNQTLFIKMEAFQLDDDKHCFITGDP